MSTCCAADEARQDTPVERLRRAAEKRSFGLTDPVARAYCRHGYLLALEDAERELKRSNDAA